MKIYTLADKILYIAKYEYNYFLQKQNVVGVGLGYKIKNGFLTNNICIKIFVVRKLKKSSISYENLIPYYYKGVQTDVVETGIFKSSSFTNRVRPVTGGYNFGSTEGLSNGTMGCLVTDGKFYHMLSNYHVLLSDYSARIGTTVIQPSCSHGGFPPDDIVGNISKYIELKYMTSSSTPENLVDCAMAKITKRSLVSTKITLLGRIKGVEKPKLHENVQKVGSTSELTKGKITDIGITSIVTYKTGQCLFKDQIFTTKMAFQGDSGSILLSNNMKAIGLVVSNTSSQTMSNPIENVLDALGVKLVVE